MLPPLPEPKRYFGHSTSSPMYDKDEMTAYAMSAVNQAYELLSEAQHMLAHSACKDDDATKCPACSLEGRIEDALK